jgi:filamentous hemagglutinin
MLLWSLICIFQNREGLLPSLTDGNYIEYVHPTPNISGPGSQRIIIAPDGTNYYSPDHYRTFIRFK